MAERSATPGAASLLCTGSARSLKRTPFVATAGRHKMPGHPPSFSISTAAAVSLSPHHAWGNVASRSGTFRQEYGLSLIVVVRLKHDLKRRQQTNIPQLTLRASITCRTAASEFDVRNQLPEFDLRAVQERTIWDAGREGLKFQTSNLKQVRNLKSQCFKRARFGGGLAHFAPKSCRKMSQTPVERHKGLPR